MRSISFQSKVRGEKAGQQGELGGGEGKQGIRRRSWSAPLEALKRV